MNGNRVLTTIENLRGDSPAVIEMFADVSCPFAYVGLRRLLSERDARGSSTRVRVRAWPLEWVNGCQLDPALVAAEITALRTSLAPGLYAGFDQSRFPHSTIRAMGPAAAAYADDADIGEHLSLRLREAVFEEGRDVGDDGELKALAGEFGIEVATRPVAEKLVRAEWERGRDRGVRGSPHFFAGNHNWFCPSLKIHHVGDDFDISFDERGIEQFYDAVFRPGQR